MPSAPQDQLLFAGAIVFALAVCVLVRVLGWRMAATVALLRVGLTLALFALFDPLQARILDDLTYAQRARDLLAGGVGPWEVLTDADAAGALSSAAGSRHVGFYFLNLLAQSVFGPFYSSGVLLNVVLSAVGARAVFALTRTFGESVGRARNVALFFLLHWDVLAWSSFFNLKDTAVLALSAWALVWFLRLLARPGLVPLVGTVLSVTLVLFFRWYVSVLLIGSFVAYGFVTLRGWSRIALLVVSFAGLSYVLQATIRFGLVQPGAFPSGSMRFLLTPQPWAIVANYRFLLIPATLHWVLLPLTLYGAVRLWRRVPAARLVLIYFAIVVAFYAMVPLLQGPRHRYQASFALVLMQFEGIRAVLMRILGRPRARSRAPGEHGASGAERGGAPCAA